MMSASKTPKILSFLISVSIYHSLKLRRNQINKMTQTSTQHRKGHLKLADRVCKQFKVQTKLLAPMSSSISKYVTKSVGSHFVQFGAFKAFEAKGFKVVTRLLQGCIKGAPRAFQGCFKSVLKFFSNEVTRLIHR